MKTTHRLIGAALAATLMGTCLTLQAGQIPIANPSFEAITGTDTNHFDQSGRLRDDHDARYPEFVQSTDPLGYGTDDPVPGWAVTRQWLGGTYKPAAPRFPTGIPDGQNLAYVNVGAGTVVSLSQTLCNVLVPGSYTLNVSVGRRSDVPFPGYRVQLFAGGYLVGEDANTLQPPVGGFVRTTISTNVPAIHPGLGSHLEIRLSAFDYSVEGRQVNFDQVELVGPPSPCLLIRPAVEIIWQSESNKWYQVLWSTDLPSTNWVPLELPIPWGGQTNVTLGTGTNNIVWDSTAGRARRFYMLVETNMPPTP